MPRRDELPPPVQISPAPRMAAPAVVLLTAAFTGFLALLVAIAMPLFTETSASMPAPVGTNSPASLPTLSPLLAPDAAAALIALATRLAEPPPSPGPLAVYEVSAPTPTPVPTRPPDPVQQTVVAAWTPTPTLPACPAARLCIWPTNTPTPVPTSTPFPLCVTPQPNKVCDPHSLWIPPTKVPKTPTPAAGNAR